MMRREFLVRSTLRLGALLVTADGASGATRSIANTLLLTPARPTGWVKNDTNASIDQDESGDTWMIIGGNDWAVYRGRDIDRMVLQHTFRANFARPHSDDLYWPSGLWIDRRDGQWYCAVHCEYNYGRYTKAKVVDNWSPDHRRRMALATSRDQGRTWEMRGDILTGDNPEEPSHYLGDYYDKGPGDAQVFMDERYFYAFYREGWCQKSTGRFYESVRSARCAKADRMAQGAWHKWYRGTWDEPGLAGHDTDVFNSKGADTAYVFYSHALGRYVSLIGAGDWEKPEGYIATCTNLAAQDWTDPIRFANAATHKWYNWAVDPTTLSRHEISGHSFRYYTSTNSSPVWYHATFTDAPSHPIVKPPLYPPDSVDDYNSGWDRRR